MLKILTNSVAKYCRRDILRPFVLAACCALTAQRAFGDLLASSQIPNIFKPESTPAHTIFHLSIFVLIITALIFTTVFSLLVYSVIKFRRRADDDGHEPVPVYGSNQVELAWTVIPVLIVLVLFFATARAIHDTQDAEMPRDAIEVTAIGHQFWWEFRYPRARRGHGERTACAEKRSVASDAYLDYSALC